jgi:hypothetical protein
MKVKSLALLLIFTCSLIPFNPVQAESGITHTLQDALLLLYTSETVLLDTEGDLSLLHILAAPVLDDPPPDLEDKTMAAVLQSLKEWRNDLDKNCKLLTSQYRSEGKDCEADRIQAVCDQYRQQINNEIGIYHDLRGDKRKAPTKVWHFLKRNGRNLWHKIGPVGRTFLRRLGPEVAQVVLSGGTMTGGALRKLVKQVARSIGREKIQKIVYRGVERLLRGQIEILQAAGVDICDPDAELTNEVEQQLGILQDTTGAIPDGTRWECADVDGPVANLLESRQSTEDIKTNYYEFDHWLIYKASSSTLEYFYSYENSEEHFTVIDSDGTLGWATMVWSGKFEDSSVPIDDYGVFTVPLTWNERRTQLGHTVEVPQIYNRWGLIPKGNYQTVYICDWGPREMPTGLETLTPENFRDRCGVDTLGSWYFECALSP